MRRRRRARLRARGRGHRERARAADPGASADTPGDMRLAKIPDGGVVDQADDLHGPIRPIASDPETLTERVSTGEQLLGQGCADDADGRRARFIVPREVTAPHAP